MANAYSNTNSEDLANVIYESLTEGVSFDLPPIDLDDAQYNLGDTSNNPLYSRVNRITLDELTTREPCGSGTFDALMESYAKHIKLEYEAGRITGSEYARAYVELTSSAMSQSIQFLLGKDQAYWAALVAQAQGKTAEIAAIQALVDLARTKAEYNMALVGVSKVKADLALTKMQLSSEDARYALTKTQSDIEIYRLNNIMPVELTQLQEVVQMTTSQRLNVDREGQKMDYEINTLLPDQHTLNLKQIEIADNQILKTEKDIEILDFQISDMLPAEIQKITAEIGNITAATSKTNSEREGIIYNTNFIMPAQKQGIDADTAIKEYQVGHVLPGQVENMESDTLIKEYTRSQILPAQRILTVEQGEAKRAETLDIRTDGATVRGVMGKQKDLYTQQISSYKRDAEYKVARMLVDSWITQKGVDEGTTTPVEMSNPAIDNVINRIKVNNELN